MKLQQSVYAIMDQLEASVNELTNSQFCERVDTLSGASVGQHVRHVVEMFVCLQEGYITGIVNYEKRKRDVEIETSKETAISVMTTIKAGLENENRQLVLEAGFDENSHEVNRIPTNYFREIAYNLEHAIHHMALIKIGICQISKIQLPEGYGVASSTIKYRKESQVHS